MTQPTMTSLERDAYEALYRQISQNIRYIFRDDRGETHDWLRFADPKEIFIKIDEVQQLRVKLNEVGKKLNYKPI